MEGTERLARGSKTRTREQTLILNYLPTSLNEYINAERTSRYLAANIKKTETEKIAWLAKVQHLKPIKEKVKIDILWFIKNKKKDPDNIAFAKKFIIDGLVMAGILKNDNLNNIYSFSDNFLIKNSGEGAIVKLIVAGYNKENERKI